MKVASMLVWSGLFAVALPVWATPVTGRIVDENQKPIAGAKVRVFLSGQGAATPLNLTTDLNGDFAAEIPDAAPPKAEVAPTKSTGLAQLQVVAPGLALTQFIWKTPGEVFTLAVGQSWSGLVLGEDEKPLAGVRVAVTQFRVDGAYTYIHLSGER